MLIGPQKKAPGNPWVFLFQDFGLPLKKLKKGIEYYHEEVEVYPIWLCPAKAMDVGEL